VAALAGAALQRLQDSHRERPRHVDAGARGCSPQGVEMQASFAIRASGGAAATRLHGACGEPTR